MYEYGVCADVSMPSLYVVLRTSVHMLHDLSDLVVSFHSNTCMAELMATLLYGYSRVLSMGTAFRPERVLRWGARASVDLAPIFHQTILFSSLAPRAAARGRRRSHVIC